MEKGVLAEVRQGCLRQVGKPAESFSTEYKQIIGSLFLIDMPSLLTGILIIEQRFHYSKSFAPAGRYINSPVRRGGRGKEISLRKVSPRGTTQKIMNQHIALPKI